LNHRTAAEEAGCRIVLQCRRPREIYIAWGACPRSSDAQLNNIYTYAVCVHTYNIYYMVL
jgi:hypothetical protein